MQRLPFVLLGSGFLVLAISVAAWFILPQFIETSSTMGKLEGGLPLWESRKDIKTNTYIKVHLFHVNNPGEILQGQKPSLKEVGPYVYQKKVTRVAIAVGEDNDTATYKDYQEYQFEPEMSSGSESDIVTIINLPWVGLAQEMAQMSTISRLLVMGIVSRHNESIFMTRPIKELLFGGYYHHIIATFASITGESYMPNNTFGLFYGRNNTFEDEREISLGSNNPLDFGKVLKWKNQTEMEWWNDENCKKLKGSDWNTFPPGTTPKTTLQMFMPDLCRNIKFLYEEDIYYEGVSGYRFTIPRSELQDPRVNRDNMCYCTIAGRDHENCPKDGLYQINACSKGASVLISFPHFYQGSSEYIDKIDGLHPDAKLHQTFVDLEPNTGQVLRSALRTQVNLHLKPLRSVSEFRKVPNLIFPVMWTDEASHLPEPEVSLLSSHLPATAAGSIVKLLSVGMMAAGFVLLIVGSIVFMVRLRKKNYPV